MRPESLEFLIELLNAPSPSGYEVPAADAYRKYVGAYADKVHTDVHGNVWAILNPDAEMKVMLAGHMDEIGFVVHYVNDDGYIYFRPVGGHDPVIPVGQRVWIHGKEKVFGVIGRKPIHLLEAAEREKRPELHELWIDIGAKNKEEVEKLITLGDPVTFQYEYANLQGERVVARGCDDKLGSWVVAEALRILKEGGKLDPKVGVYAVATVQEEVGLRGAKTSAYGINAQTGIAVDVDFAIDYPGISKERYGKCNLGAGPTVNRGPNINPITFTMMLEAAKNEGIEIQPTVSGGPTGTDANAMQVNASGMATGLAGIPLRYMHTPNEIFELKDAEDCAKLLAGYCLLVKPDTDFTPR